jgi:hypothetical protein
MPAPTIESPTTTAPRTFTAFGRTDNPSNSVTGRVICAQNHVFNGGVMMAPAGRWALAFIVNEPTLHNPFTLEVTDPSGTTTLPNLTIT